MIEVRDLDAREIYRFYGDIVVAPLKGYAARSGNRTVALGGLAIGTDGKVWGFMDSRLKLRALYRYTLRLLDWAARNGIAEVYVVRDATLDTSERMLRRGGFERCGEHVGQEVWVWKEKKNG